MQYPPCYISLISLDKFTPYSLSTICGGVRVCGARPCGVRVCGARPCGVRVCGARPCGVRVCGARPHGFC